MANTPAAIAGWIQRQPELRLASSFPVTVGGLRGRMIDVRVKRGAVLPTVTCPDIGGQSFTIFLLFKGLKPSSGAHGVVAGMTMRLYLLRYRRGTLALEVNDKDLAPGTLRSLTAVARRFKFAA